MKRTFAKEDDQFGSISTTTETLSSIELSKSTKGVYSWTIKTYYDENSSEGKDWAINEVVDIDRRLKQKFPGDENN